MQESRERAEKKNTLTEICFSESDGKNEKLISIERSADSKQTLSSNEGSKSAESKEDS